MFSVHFRLVLLPLNVECSDWNCLSKSVSHCGGYSLNFCRLSLVLLHILAYFLDPADSQQCCYRFLLLLSILSNVTTFAGLSCY